MADIETQKLAKMAVLVEKFLAQQAKGYEILEEMKALLDSEPTQGQLAKRLLVYFATHWRRRFDESLVVNAPRDLAALKRLLKQLPAAEIERRMTMYLADPDDFARRNRYTLAIFVARVNHYGLAGAQADRFAPVGCGHTPRCKDDVEHTRRRTDEAKGSPF